MKKLIDGKLYDTEISTELTRWSNKSTIDDLWFEEALYKTTEGDYFICGKGGSLTPYAKHDGERLAGCDIRPLTRYEAAVWAAIHIEKDLIEKDLIEKDLLTTEFPGDIDNA